MINIAICDEDVTMGETVASYVERFLSEEKEVCEQRVFVNTCALIYEIEDGANYDLLLLNMDMSKTSGIGLMERIKENLPEAVVIIIISHEKYVYEAIKIQPFRLIPKKYLEQMIFLALRDAMGMLKKREKEYYFVENQKGIEKIPIRSITYIWHREKYTYIEKTDDTMTKVRKTLKQIYMELPQADFVWIDRGCICNLLQIDRINGGDVILTDGTRLQISRNRLTEVKKILRKYWCSEIP